MKNHVKTLYWMFSYPSLIISWKICNYWQFFSLPNEVLVELVLTMSRIEPGGWFILTNSLTDSWMGDEKSPGSTFSDPLNILFRALRNHPNSQSVKTCTINLTWEFGKKTSVKIKKNRKSIPFIYWVNLTFWKGNHCSCKSSPLLT